MTSMNSSEAVDNPPSFRPGLSLRFFAAFSSLSPHIAPMSISIPDRKDGFPRNTSSAHAFLTADRPYVRPHSQPRKEEFPLENAINTLGFDVRALWITFGTMVALATITLLILQLNKICRELRSPALLNVQTIREKLQSDHERLTKLELSNERQESELKLLLRAQIVMLHHSIDGNSVSNLKAMLKQIEEYLVFGEIKE